MSRLEDKVALVTGASKGIGAGIAKGLAAAWASYGVSPIAIASDAAMPSSFSSTDAKMSGCGFDRSASSAVQPTYNCNSW